MKTRDRAAVAYWLVLFLDLEELKITDIGDTGHGSLEDVCTGDAMAYNWSYWETVHSCDRFPES